jgi:hypothetical protein
MMTATRHWWRRGMAVGMVLLAAMMLSACIEVDQRSTIGSDFKGTTTMKIGVSKLFLETISSLGNSLGVTTTPGSGASGNPQDPFADLASQVTAMGGTAKPYSTDQFTGVEITMPFNSLDEMQNQINMLLGSSSGSSASSLGGSSGSDALVQITAKETASSVRIDGTINPLSDLGSATGSAAGAPPGLDLTALLAGGGQIQIAFTMPGKIQSADPLARQSGSTVSWSFKIGDKGATIFAESDKS